MPLSTMVGEDERVQVLLFEAVRFAAATLPLGIRCGSHVAMAGTVSGTQEATTLTTLDKADLSHTAF